MLKKLSEENKTWDEVQRGLINEIIRLTSLAYMTADNGWQTIPLETAISRKVLDDEERREIEGKLVFFTLAVCMFDRSQLGPMMEAVNGLWGSQVTSSALTEFLSSLPISTPAVSSGETATTALVPH